VEDPVDVNRRIEQLVARVRRRDVYGRLLASGEVILPVEKVPDPDAWRAEIRRQAGSDRLKVQTGVTAGKVWAMLAGDIPEAQQDENLRYFHLFTSDLEPRAAALGHQVRVVIRDGEEALLICRACGARGYADAAAGPLIGGPLFDDECSEGDPLDAD
jgi:hypothetical protein